MKGTYSLSRGGKGRMVDAWVDSISYTSGQPGAETALLLKGVNLYVDSTRAASGFYEGKGSVRVEQQLFTRPDQQSFDTENHHMVVALKEREDGLEGSLDYSVDNAVLRTHPLGDIKMHLNFDRLDVVACREIWGLYKNVVIPQAIAAGQAGRLLEPQLTPHEQAQWQTSLQRLLAGRPRFWLRPLLLMTSPGVGEFNVTLELSNPGDPRLAELPLAIQRIHAVSAALRLSESTVWALAKLQLKMQGVSNVGKRLDQLSFMKTLYFRNYVLGGGLKLGGLFDHICVQARRQHIEVQ